MQERNLSAFPLAIAGCNDDDRPLVVPLATNDTYRHPLLHETACHLGKQLNKLREVSYQATTGSNSRAPQQSYSMLGCSMLSDKQLL